MAQQGVNYQGSEYNPAPQVFGGQVTVLAGASLVAQGGIQTTPQTVTTPSVPATTVAATNSTGTDVMVYLTSGGAAVTVIKVNAITTGLTLGTTGSVSVYLPAGASITLTYASTAPTWVWVGI